MMTLLPKEQGIHDLSKVRPISLFEIIRKMWAGTGYDGYGIDMVSYTPINMVLDPNTALTQPSYTY